MLTLCMPKHILIQEMVSRGLITDKDTRQDARLQRENSCRVASSKRAWLLVSWRGVG